MAHKIGAALHWYDWGCIQKRHQIFVAVCLHSQGYFCTTNLSHDGRQRYHPCKCLINMVFDFFFKHGFLYSHHVSQSEHPTDLNHQLTAILANFRTNSSYCFPVPLPVIPPPPQKKKTWGYSLILDLFKAVFSTKSLW